MPKLPPAPLIRTFCPGWMLALRRNCSDVGRRRVQQPPLRSSDWKAGGPVLHLRSVRPGKCTRRARPGRPRWWRRPGRQPGTSGQPCLSLRPRPQGPAPARVVGVCGFRTTGAAGARPSRKVEPPDFAVRRRHGCGVDPYKHLTVLGVRLLHLPELKDLRWAVTCAEDRSHGFPLLLGPGCRALLPVRRSRRGCRGRNNRQGWKPRSSILDWSMTAGEAPR